MFLKNMTHALVMECLVLEPLAMEYSIQERKQMILKRIIKANETKNYWIWSGGLLKKRDLILKV